MTERGSVWRFLSAQTCSSIGALALTTALGKQVYDLTDSELALGLLGLVEFLPSLVLVLVSGTLADRLDRRRLAATALLLEAAAAGCLAWYATTDPTSAGPIFALVALFGVARAFAGPAARSMPADLVPRPQLPWLTVRYSGSWQVAAIVGPVFGGMTYAVDPWVPFATVTGLFVLAAAGFTTVRYAAHVRAAHTVVTIAEPLDAVEPGEADLIDDLGVADEREDGVRPERPLHEALEGFRFIRSQSVLLGAITLDLMAVLFGGAIALLPAIAEDRLGVGAVGLGWLRAAVGIGAALMTIGLAVRPVRRHIGVVLLLSVAAFGVGTVVLGATTSYVVAFVALAFLAAADAVSMYIRVTLVPLLTPDVMRGRVLAMESVLIGASNELGAFESGVTGQIFGAAPAIVLGGVMSVIVAVGWWFGFPALRKTDVFPASPLTARSAPGSPPRPSSRRSPPSS